MSFIKLPTYRIPQLHESPNYQHSQHLMLKWLSTGDESRGQIIVPIKVAKTAIMRNSIKRKIRAYLAKMVPQTQHKDILIMAKKGVGELNSEQLQQQLQQIFGKLTPQ